MAETWSLPCLDHPDMRSISGFSWFKYQRWFLGDTPAEAYVTIGRTTGGCDGTCAITLEVTHGETKTHLVCQSFSSTKLIYVYRYIYIYVNKYIHLHIHIYIYTLIYPELSILVDQSFKIEHQHMMLSILQTRQGDGRRMVTWPTSDRGPSTKRYQIQSDTDVDTNMMWSLQKMLVQPWWISEASFLPWKKWIKHMVLVEGVLPHLQIPYSWLLFVPQTLGTSTAKDSSFPVTWLSRSSCLSHWWPLRGSQHISTTCEKLLLGG